MIFNTGYYTDSTGYSYGGSGTYDSPILVSSATLTEDSIAELLIAPRIVGSYYKTLDTSEVYQWNGIKFVGLDGASDIGYRQVDSVEGTYVSTEGGTQGGGTYTYAYASVPGVTYDSASVYTTDSAVAYATASLDSNGYPSVSVYFTGGGSCTIFVYCEGEYSYVIEIPVIVVQDDTDYFWATASDATIVSMLERAYAGTIDLSEFWAVGDTRTVTLSAMSATGVGESHASQDVELVLMNAGGKTLSDGNECKFVVGLADCLAERGYMNSGHTNSGGWSECARRTWCNEVFYIAIPDTLRPIFKEFQNYTGQYSGSVVTTVDYFALPAEHEVFGSTSYAAGDEASNLTQFDWYKTSANRIKTLGTSGSSGPWWERSPDSSLASGFCSVTSGGSDRSYSAGTALGLSPFGCI